LFREKKKINRLLTKQADRQKEIKQIKRQNEKSQTYVTYKQAGRQAGRQTDRQTDQTDRQTDRQTDQHYLAYLE
jgi:hypothetical protein